MLTILLVLITGIPTALSQTVHFAGANSSINHSFWHPEGLAIDSAGDLYVADYDAKAVYEVEAVNGQIPASPTVLTLGSGFAGPTGVAVDASGNVYVADFMANAVKELVPVNGAIPASPAINVLGSGFWGPQDVAVDSNGDVFVSDYEHNEVKEIVASGGVIPASPTINVIGSGFFAPIGLALDASGNLFVADSGNWEVKEVLASGGYTTVLTLGGGFKSPAGVAVDASGNVFVADTNNYRSKEILASGGYATVDVLGCCGYPPFGAVTDAKGNLYISDAVDGRIVEFSLAGGNFGTVNVGSTSTLYSMSFTFETAGSAASVKVVTQGAASQDFAVATSDLGVCLTQMTAGEQCDVDVTFTPTRPGLRDGSVELLDSSGNLLASGPLFGYGVGPQVGFPPGVQTILGGGFTWVDSAAVDAGGNVFVTDKDANAVKELTAASGYTTAETIGNGFNHPVGVAIDGAGNLFIADEGNNAVKEILAVGGYATVNTLGSGFSSPEAVAVDASGNVFVADGGNGAVKEILAVNGSIPTSPKLLTLATCATMGESPCWPEGVAIDASENVYVADYYYASIKQLAAVAGALPSSPTINSLGSGLYRPYGVAVDANGNLFVADNGNQALKEIPASGGYVTAHTVINNFLPLSVALDARGNIYLPGGPQGSGINELLKLDASEAPALTFATTSIGQTSAAQTVSVANTGNAALIFPVPNQGNNPFIGENFTWNSSSGSACPLVASHASQSATLAAGASCQLAISFAPAEVGNISDWMVLWDNALNAPGPAYAVQNISLESTGTAQVLPPTLGAGFSAASIPLNSTVTETFNVGNPNSNTTLNGVGFLESLSSGLAVASVSANTCSGTLTANIGGGSIGLTSATLTGGETCAITVTLTGTQGGVQTVATLVSSIEGGAGDSGNLSVTVVAPATLTAAFTPASISTEGIALLTFTIQNLNTGTRLSNIGFAATLPAGLTVAPMTAYFFTGTNVCGTGTAVAATSSNTFTLSGGKISSSSSCTVSIYVTASTTGQKNLTTSTVTSDKGGIGAAATASLEVSAPPVFTVTTTNDDPTGVAANCTDQSQPGAQLDASCSLRDAIAQAGATAQAGMQTVDQIKFGAIVPTVNFSPALTSSGPATITLGSGGALIVLQGMTICGPGSSLLTVSGAGLYQVFNVAASYYTSMAISGLTIANGSSTNGGGVYNAGILALANVKLTGNAAASGGGIWNAGALTLTNSTLSNNSAITAGGGLYNGYAMMTSTIQVGDIVLGYNYNFNYGSAVVLNSTFDSNSAPNALGGGAYNETTGTAPACPGGYCSTTTTGGLAPLLTITNSTFTANTAGSGGALYNLSPTATCTLSNSLATACLVVTDSTIAGNTAATGGGIDIASGTLTLQNDIATGNTATTLAPDIAGSYTDGGGNLLGASSGSGSSASANLASLGNYGGPTRTMPPMPSSTAICAGLAANLPSGLTTDQRGNPRTTANYGTPDCVDSGAVQTAYTIGFGTEPSTTQINQDIAPSPTVAIYDNAVTIPLAGASIALTPSSGSMNGTAAVSTGAAGSAIFGGLNFASEIFGEQLTAAMTIGSGSLPAQTATSSSFDIVTVDHIAITAPATVIAGTPVNATLTAYEDAASQRVATFYNGTFSFSSSDGGAVLPANTALVSGTATVAFTFKTAGQQTVAATGQGNAFTASSANIGVSAGAASSISAVSGGGQSAVIGAAFANPLVVTVADAYGNVVSGVTVVFAAPPGGASAVLSTPAATGQSGRTSVIATANGHASASTYTVTASVAGASAPAQFILLDTQSAAALTVTPGTTALAYGQPVTITAQFSPVSAGGSAPTGLVNFYEGATGLMPASQVSGAAARYTVSVPSVGSHSYAAQYAGDANFLASELTQASSAVVVSTASATIAGAAAQSTYGQSGSASITLTGAYTGAGIAVPGGQSSVAYTITNGSSTVVASGSVTPVPVSASSTVSVPVPATLSAGSYSVNLSYAGDGNFTSTLGSVALTVARAAQTISFTPPSPVTYGVLPITLTAAGGGSANPVTFSYVSGPASLNGSTLTVTGAGIVTVSANEAEDANYTAAPSVTQSITVNKAAAWVAVSGNITPILVQNSVTFTATVSSTAGTPTGSVNFLSGSAILGSGTLVSGVATLITAGLTVGSDGITAVYQGDANFAAATSNAFTETVEDFTLTAGNNSSSVTAGSEAQFALNIGPSGAAVTFPAVVNLTVTGAPTGTIATLSPTIIPAGSGSAAVTLSVQVPQSFAAASAAHGHAGAALHGLAPLTLAWLLIPFTAVFRRARERTRRALLRVLLLVASIALAAGFSGCGGSGFFADLSHSYTLTVTATSGQLSHSTVVTLTVEPPGE